MGSSLTYVLHKPSRSDACVHHHQHIWANLLQQAVSPMHFRDIIAAYREPHHRMAATLGQEHTAHLRIGTGSILIATPTKSERVGFRIGSVEHGAIDGHEPIATKEGTGHGRPLGDHLTALAHEGLHALASQGRTSSTQSRITHRALGRSRMQIAELSYQALPHLALVPTAPEGHGDHKQHEGHDRTQ